MKMKVAIGLSVFAVVTGAIALGSVYFLVGIFSFFLNGFFHKKIHQEVDFFDLATAFVS